MPLDLEFQAVDRRQTIRSQIYDALRDAIVRLRLKPGQQLSENKIAQHGSNARHRC
jgi:DNA-binding GntR family transcriptional regulator